MNDQSRKALHESRRDSYLDLFIENIKKNKNFTFTKYGDGEMSCITGAQGENCDGHPYSDELGSLLKKSLIDNTRREDVYIGDWTGWRGDTLSFCRDGILRSNGINCKNFVLYELLLNHELEPNEKLYEFIREIKSSERKKIFVGPHKLSAVNNLINSERQIAVQARNAFAAYDSLREQCLSLVETGCIFIFSCGMPSKILINDILFREKESTCLDFGSGFDNIVLDEPTRDGQANPMDMKSFYKNLLT